MTPASVVPFPPRSTRRLHSTTQHQHRLVALSREPRRPRASFSRPPPRPPPLLAVSSARRPEQPPPSDPRPSQPSIVVNTPSQPLKPTPAVSCRLHCPRRRLRPSVAPPPRQPRPAQAAAVISSSLVSPHPMPSSVHRRARQQVTRCFPTTVVLRLTPSVPIRQPSPLNPDQPTKPAAVAASPRSPWPALDPTRIVNVDSFDNTRDLDEEQVQLGDRQESEDSQQECLADIAEEEAEA